jgi:hypothetical protein
MQKYYKLLSKEMTSHNDTKWELNVPISIEKPGKEMCTDQVLHCYNHPLLAVFLKPIHTNIKEPCLFEIVVDEIVNSDGLKFASKSQTLINEIPLPEISTEQRIAISIKIAKTVYKDEKWNEWADKWLSGEDRSSAAALAAARAAIAAARVAIAAARAAIAGARAADDSASLAVDAAYYAAGAAVDAVDAAGAHAAHAVAYAAAYAAGADKNEFNKQLIEIVEEILGKTYNKEQV